MRRRPASVSNPAFASAVTGTAAMAVAVGLAVAGCNVINEDLLPADAGGGPGDPDAAADATPDAAPAAARLMLHYAFEEEGAAVVDQSGRGLDGTLSDVTAWTASGRVGRGLALAGGAPATQFVSLPSGVLTGVDDFTVAVWVNVVENAPWARIYDLGNGLTDPANRFMFLTVSGFDTTAAPLGLHASSYGGSASNEVQLSARASLPTGVWKHVALTGSGGERQLFVDGFPVAVLRDAAVVPPSEMEPLAPQSWLGRSRFPDPGLAGTLDEFRIYDGVLSAGEIQDLASPRSDYTYWRFDEGTGTMAADSSDHAIAATLAGGVTWTAGRLGQALAFPGDAGAHVALATSPLAGCTDQLTVAAWVKLHQLTIWSRVFDFGDGTSRFIYLAPSDGTGMHFAMVSPAGLFDLATPTHPITGDDTWHHVAVTVDGAHRVTLYVDGASVAEAENPTVLPADFAATRSNWLGRSRFAADPYLDGAIDELRVACRAYTRDEIAMLGARE